MYVLRARGNFSVFLFLLYFCERGCLADLNKILPEHKRGDLHCTRANAVHVHVHVYVSRSTKYGIYMSVIFFRSTRQNVTNSSNICLRASSTASLLPWNSDLKSSRSPRQRLCSGTSCFPCRFYWQPSSFWACVCVENTKSKTTKKNEIWRMP